MCRILDDNFGHNDGPVITVVRGGSTSPSATLYPISMPSLGSPSSGSSTHNVTEEDAASANAGCLGSGSGGAGTVAGDSGNAAIESHYAANRRDQMSKLFKGGSSTSNTSGDVGSSPPSSTGGGNVSHSAATSSGGGIDSPTFLLTALLNGFRPGLDPVLFVYVWLITDTPIAIDRSFAGRHVLVFLSVCCRC